MSDRPPPLAEQGPTEPAPKAPQTCGIRAGKAAQRKRKVFIRWSLELNPDLSEDQVYIVHADKSRRPLYTRAGSTPENLEEDDQVPDTPPPAWHNPGQTPTTPGIPEPKTPPEAASSSAAPETPADEPEELVEVVVESEPSTLRCLRPSLHQCL